MKKNRIWEICFSLTIIVTLLLIIFGRVILTAFGITATDINSTIGGYIASLIGAMIGAFLAVFSAGLVDNKKEKQRIKKEQMNNAKLLVCDLKTMLRIMQNNYAVTSFSAYMKEYEGSPFYSLLTGISERYDLATKRKYEYLLSSERRAEIISESDEDVFLDRKEKEQLLSFISGYILPEDDLVYSSQIAHQINETLCYCEYAYKSVISILDDFNKQQNIFDSDKIGIYDMPLIEGYIVQISNYIFSFLKHFLSSPISGFSINEANAIIMNLNADFWMGEEEFNERLLCRDRDNLSNVIEENSADAKNEENGVLGILDSFCRYLENEEGKQQFNKDIDDYMNNLFEKIELNESFDKSLKAIQKDFNSLLPLNNISNQDKKKKLDKLYDLISQSFQDQLLENNLNKQIVIPYGRQKYLLPTTISNWLSFQLINEFVGISGVKNIFEYKQNYFKLKYVLIPKLRDLLGATNWEYGVSREIINILNKLEWRTKNNSEKKTKQTQANANFTKSLLSVYTFTADRYIDADGSVTLSLNELNLAESDKTEDETKKKLAASILEYSKDFYNDFNYWGTAPNLKGDIPYIMKALILDDVDKIAECIKCQDGKD